MIKQPLLRQENQPLKCPPQILSIMPPLPRKDFVATDQVLEIIATGPAYERHNLDMEPLPSSRIFQIFAVDDAPDIRELLRGALSESNWKVSVFESGEQVLEACQEQVPDLLISDLIMPGIDGNELCSRVKSLHPEEFLPVMLLTAKDSTEDKISGLDSGADDYLTKPFNFEELKARARALLRTRSLTLALKEAKNLIEEKERQIIASQIAAGTAHELGQPLTTIVLNCRLLRETPSGSIEQNEILEAIESGCGEMKEILGRLANLEQYSSSKYVAGLAVASISSEKEK